LQLHYADAISPEVVRKQQRRITRELGEIDRQMAVATNDHELVTANLQAEVTFASQVGKAYQEADDAIRRQINQAILKRVWIDEDGIAAVEFTEQFGRLLDPEFVRQAKVAKTKKATAIVREALAAVDQADFSLADMDRLWETVVFNFDEPALENAETPRTDNSRGPCWFER